MIIGFAVELQELQMIMVNILFKSTKKEKY